MGLSDSHEAHPLQLPCFSLSSSCQGFYESRQNPKSSPVASCLLQKVVKATFLCFHAEFLEVSSPSNAEHALVHPFLTCVPAELLLLGLPSKAKEVCKIEPVYRRACCLQGLFSEGSFLWNALPCWSQIA